MKTQFTSIKALNSLLKECNNRGMNDIVTIFTLESGADTFLFKVVYRVSVPGSYDSYNYSVEVTVEPGLIIFEDAQNTSINSLEGVSPPLLLVPQLMRG